LGTVLLNALGWIIFLFLPFSLLNRQRVVDSTRLLQGTPRRLRFWMPMAPPSPLHQWYLCV
jgi:hypothetical protein